MTSHGFQQWLQARKMDEADIFNLFYEATTKNPKWSDYLQNNGQEDFMRLVHEKLFQVYQHTLLWYRSNNRNFILQQIKSKECPILSQQFLYLKKIETHLRDLTITFERLWTIIKILRHFKKEEEIDLEEFVDTKYGVFTHKDTDDFISFVREEYKIELTQ